MVGLLIACVSLVAGALILLGWDRLHPRSARRAAPWITLAALLIGVAGTGVPSGPPTGGLLGVLQPDAWSGLWRGLLLLGLALRLVLEPGFGEPSPNASAVHALQLLAAAGATLAISTRDLLLLTLGVVLYATADANARPAAREQAPWVRPLGVGALAFGTSLVYAATATLDLDGIASLLWERPGPQAALLYLGVGLLIAGLALLTRLLTWRATSEPATGSDAVTGVATLGRVCLGAFGALGPVWGWLLASVGLLLMVQGWLAARRRHDQARVKALHGAQAGLLLVALASAPTRAGLLALIMAGVAFWLAELIVATIARITQYEGPDAEVYTGLHRRNPWLGGAALVGLLSLAGLPLTLGFAGRAALAWAARDGDAGGLIVAALAVLLSALCAADYLQVLLTIYRASAGNQRVRVSSYVLVLLLIAASALLVLAVYPSLFSAWVTRIVG